MALEEFIAHSKSYSECSCKSWTRVKFLMATSGIGRSNSDVNMDLYIYLSQTGKHGAVTCHSFSCQSLLAAVFELQCSHSSWPFNRCCANPVFLELFFIWERTRIQLDEYITRIYLQTNLANSFCDLTQQCTSYGSVRRSQILFRSGKQRT